MNFKKQNELIKYFSKTRLESYLPNATVTKQFRLAKQNKQVTHDRIISELTLGFWTNLFSKRYSQYKFQSFLVKNVFKDCPKKQRNIKNIQFNVNEIREIRNRVCHYENIIQYADINKKYQNIQICISWISKELASVII